MSKLKEDLVVRGYYSLSQASEVIGVKKETLRSWLFKFYPTMKDFKRLSTNQTIKLPRAMVDNLKVVYMLRKIELYTLEGVAKQLNKMNVEYKKQLINEFNERKLL